MDAWRIGKMNTPVSRRRTKIVATVGPACRKPEQIAALIQAGVNIFRLNFSHGTHEEHAEIFHRIRAEAEKFPEPIGILADLCGPKIRVGKFLNDSIELHDNESVVVTTRDVLGQSGLIPSGYTELARDVRPGDRILIDDGNLELRVESIHDTEITCSVVHGGLLKNRKGMNLPGVAVSSPALTEQDRRDASFALDLGVDFLALSFVRRASDVTDLKSIISGRGLRTPVIAKIEKPEALTCLDAILEEADGLMVARGDLGVEMAPERVPIAQREMLIKARRACKPVIVATQMLESMVSNPRPTRAEVSDVSTAVFGGADAVMLSAETAAGQFPVKAVEMMDRVAREIEREQAKDGEFESLTRDDDKEKLTPNLALYQAMARSTAQLSRDLGVRAVCVRTTKGTSVHVVSASRPSAPIIALTHNETVARRLVLCWGVVPRTVSLDDFESPKRAARQLSEDLGLAHGGQYVLLLSGFGKGEPILTVVHV
jgi:pyruvate kinase